MRFTIVVSFSNGGPHGFFLAFAIEISGTADTEWILHAFSLLGFFLLPIFIFKLMVDCKCLVIASRVLPNVKVMSHQRAFNCSLVN
jgi:hypothetical protein